MKTYYTISEGVLVPTSFENSKIRVFTLEDEKERAEVMETMEIDNYDIDAALDPDELSRIEFKPHHVSIIWKRPFRMAAHETDFSVSSTGLFLHDDILTIIISKENIDLFSKEQLQHVTTTTDVLLQYFFYTIRKYLQHLKEVKRATFELETKISSSLENKAFLQMFELSESLIYYLNAIEANGAVLMKLRETISRNKGLAFTPKQLEFLDDIISENKQCTRQAQIYSSVLTGLMDARGNVINNNMNVLLKNLTLINVVFLPLNLIASMGGMSEFTMIMEKYDVNWEFAYAMFTFLMIVLSWASWHALKRFVGRPQKNGDEE